MEPTGRMFRDIAGLLSAHCYAMSHASRLANTLGVARYHGLTREVNDRVIWTGEVRLVEEALEKPLRWKRPRRIFVNSMSDLFHEHVPDEWIDRIFTIMALSPQHTFQILTKRAERMSNYLHTLKHRMGGPRSWFGHIPQAQQDALESHLVPWPLPHVWLGVSVENQRMARERIWWLIQTPARVRFLSVEPLLGMIHLAFDDWYRKGDDRSRSAHLIPGAQQIGDLIHWVIVGGESGRERRPMELPWLQSIVDQCRAFHIPVFVKQDSHLRPGQQGRISDELWALKKFPQG
jgi:protein gp37